MSEQNLNLAARVRVSLLAVVMLLYGFLYWTILSRFAVSGIMALILLAAFFVLSLLTILYYEVRLVPRPGSKLERAFAGGLAEAVADHRRHLSKKGGEPS